MACYHLIPAYKPKSGRLVFSGRPPANAEALMVPCGQCIGCRLEYSRQWAIRCEHEAFMYEKNCFLTLTYAPEHLPENSTLVKEHVTKFLKRLRKMYGEGIRYFGCGEYGEKFARPHYHIILFNFDFEDKVLYKKSGDFSLYNSPSLSRLWSFGHAVVADFSFEVAAYVARYVTKKVTGKKKDEHYQGRIQEYSFMSRMPGLGTSFFYKYYDDIVNYDRVVIRNGRVCKPPKFYDKLLRGCDDELFQINRDKRIAKFGDIDYIDDAQRYTARERLTIIMLNQNMRKYENECNQ